MSCLGVPKNVATLVRQIFVLFLFSSLDDDEGKKKEGKEEQEGEVSAFVTFVNVF